MSAWFMSLQCSEFKNFPITIERAAKVNSVRVLTLYSSKTRGTAYQKLLDSRFMI